MFSPVSLITALDRLLDTQPTSRRHLENHRGASVRLAFPVFALDMAILEGGHLATPQPGTEPGSTITVTPGVLLNLALHQPDALSGATLSGDLGLARALLNALQSFDLALALQPILGDIIAARIDTGVKAGFDWQQQATSALAANTAEYLVHEKQILASSTQIETFCREVDLVREAADRLAARLARLDQRAPN